MGMIALNELNTEPWDVRNFDHGRANELGYIYCLWSARDEYNRHKIVRINTEALSELSEIRFMISSDLARKALLKCRDRIEAAAAEKNALQALEICLERADLFRTT
jgi:hypothetical protein